ncbi:hypothetical protein K435DRAFT_864881 [Dendrothele bispora CBS 962.96]|uniref:Nitrite reductase n=1 Tax=Dendrothele bispora (strain CBS 962.96) TaxID=1314807 RepID=A0A4S8LLC8_DENBC|nr:hypothetical protein K435DRAFT_864881 [Dendrothele bispora CBS 962.96]
MDVEVLTHTSVKTLRRGEDGLCKGLELQNGEFLDCDIVVFAIGITPGDELAKTSGIQCSKKGGIIVDDTLLTSAKDVYAIGECACWTGHTYGLIAPRIEIADILSFNFTQDNTSVGTFKPRRMNNPDLSTKLKLMGVDMASFGDFFAEKRQQTSASSSKTPDPAKPTVSTGTKTALAEKKNDASAPRKRHLREGTVTTSANAQYETVTYRDPFAGVYKNADGKHVIGGMMVGDTSDYVKLVALVKKKKSLDVPPSQFILGASRGKDEDDGADLDDDTTICSCHNVSKGAITACVRESKDGSVTIETIKKKPPKLRRVAEDAFLLKDVFDIVRGKKLKTLEEVLSIAGIGQEIGCEICTCKPAVASILASLWNEHVMNPAHHQLQDTNDKFLANVQRNGTFSVIPRVAGGEITPEKLIALGTVAKKYDLYTKITGGQRIDLFGAQKPDLPAIWGELIAAGFESGHAYGKSLRTVKPCVGTTWCRYGIGDSVGMAIQLEERYKSICAPHKIKGGVSGCVRECVEAQSKLRTKAGMSSRVAMEALIRETQYCSHLMFRLLRSLSFWTGNNSSTSPEIQTYARTARWLEEMDGEIEKLRKVIIEDEPGICEELEADMNSLVGSFFDEWKAILDDPEGQKRFRQSVNTDERRDQMEWVEERGHHRPADWMFFSKMNDLDFIFYWFLTL